MIVRHDRSRIGRSLAAAGLLFTLSCASYWSSVQADAHAISSAYSWTRIYSNAFDFRYPIELRVIEESDMPAVLRGGQWFRIVAYTTRPGQEVDAGCELTFTDESIRSKMTVAHEVCHCVLDYDRLTDTGYRFGTGYEEIDKREAAAGLCSAWLTDETADGMWSRRRKEYPVEIGFKKRDQEVR